MLVLASYCFVFKDRRAILWLPLSEAGWVEFTWLICLALSRASSLLALVDVEWVWRALSPPVKYIAVMVLGWQLLGRTELKAWKLEFIFVYWKCGLLLLLQNNVLQSLHPLIPGDLSLLMFFFFPTAVRVCKRASVYSSLWCIQAANFPWMHLPSERIYISFSFLLFLKQDSHYEN